MNVSGNPLWRDGAMTNHTQHPAACSVTTGHAGRAHRRGPRPGRSHRLPTRRDADGCPICRRLLDRPRRRTDAPAHPDRRAARHAGARASRVAALALLRTSSRPSSRSTARPAGPSGRIEPDEAEADDARRRLGGRSTEAPAARAAATAAMPSGEARRDAGHAPARRPSRSSPCPRTSTLPDSEADPLEALARAPGRRRGRRRAHARARWSLVAATRIEERPLAEVAEALGRPYERRAQGAPAGRGGPARPSPSRYVSEGVVMLERPHDAGDVGGVEVPGGVGHPALERAAVAPGVDRPGRRDPRGRSRRARRRRPERAAASAPSKSSASRWSVAEALGAAGDGDGHRGAQVLLVHPLEDVAGDAVEGLAPHEAERLGAQPHGLARHRRRRPRGEALEGGPVRARTPCEQVARRPMASGRCSDPSSLRSSERLLCSVLRLSVGRSGRRPGAWPSWICSALRWWPSWQDQVDQELSTIRRSLVVELPRLDRPSS